MTADNRLIVLDDESGIRNIVADVAEMVGFHVVEANTGADFMAEIDREPPQVALIDLMLPDQDGIELLRLLAARRCRTRIILMSGCDSRILNTAQRIGIEHGLTMQPPLHKPFSVDVLEGMLEGMAQRDGPLGEADLDAAIDQGHIVPFYQPKLLLGEDGRLPVVGAEALARWRHPVRGLVSPADFIPLAERTGRIDAVTRVMLTQVVAQMAEWRAAGQTLHVSVNLAPETLTDLALPDWVARLVGQHGVAPDGLVLEITERSAMGEGTDVMEILTRFRLKGFNLSMDDFGTGYSSLRELYRMPFSELKLDRSYVKDIDASKEARIITRALIDLATNLGLSCCAEGVETLDSVEWLRQMGCRTMQGFYASPPLPADAFDRFREAWPQRETGAATPVAATA